MPLTEGLGEHVEKQQESLSVCTWREPQPQSSGWRIIAFQASAHKNNKYWAAFSRGRSRSSPLPSHQEVCHVQTMRSHSLWGHLALVSVHPKGPPGTVLNKCPTAGAQGWSLTFIPLVCLEQSARRGLTEALWSPSTQTVLWICRRFCCSLTAHAGSWGQHMGLWGAKSQLLSWVSWCINRWNMAIKVVSPEKGKPLKKRWPFNCFRRYPVKQKRWSLYERGPPPICSKNHKAKIPQPL